MSQILIDQTQSKGKRRQRKRNEGNQAGALGIECVHILIDALEETFGVSVKIRPEFVIFEGFLTKLIECFVTHQLPHGGEELRLSRLGYVLRAT